MHLSELALITIAACLWDVNDHSFPFSRCYDELWVEKLYRGFRRNLTQPFRFVCFTDRARQFSEEIEQEPLCQAEPDYGALIEPFKLDEPVIICGLDTVIVGNVDHLARYALDGHELAAPRDPFAPQRACNGVVLAPRGKKETMWDDYMGQNDMDWIRANEHVFLDDLFPGHIVSYKGHTQHFGLEDDTRIVYFHGNPKPDELQRFDWISEHWR